MNSKVVLREITTRVNKNRLDWQEVKRANEIGWKIERKIIRLSEWELELLRKKIGL